MKQAVSPGDLEEPFLELPEEAAPRLTPGPATAAELSRLLLELAADRDGESWRRRRRAARSTYERENRPEEVADSLLEFLERLTGQGAARD